MLRITTNSTMKNYRMELNSSFRHLSDAQKTVLTQRNFNSYAEDPSAAAEAFTLRRAYLRTSAQEKLCSAAMSQHDAAWSALDSVVREVNNEKATSAWASVLESLNATNEVARNALGADLEQLAENLTQSMNVQYGDTYIFSGADGADLPFSWNDAGQLCYQNIPVDTPDCTGMTVDANGNVFDANGDPVDGITEENVENWNKLQELSKESRFVDIGLGLQEDADGKVIESSAFDVSMPGINYLGYGLDENGLPNNIISIIGEMGKMLSECTGEGAWHEDDAIAKEKAEQYRALAQKFEKSAASLSTAHVHMDTQAGFLETTHEQLLNTAYTLNEQIMEIEKADMAESIMSFSWANYCYNAALSTGTSILSQTLIDYMR